MYLWNEKKSLKVRILLSARWTSKGNRMRVLWGVFRESQRPLQPRPLPPAPNGDYRVVCQWFSNWHVAGDHHQARPALRPSSQASQIPPTVLSGTSSLSSVAFLVSTPQPPAFHLRTPVQSSSVSDVQIQLSSTDVSKQPGSQAKAGASAGGGHCTRVCGKSRRFSGWAAKLELEQVRQSLSP